MELLLTLASVMLIAAGCYFTLRFGAFYIFHPIKTLRSMPKSGVKQMLLSLGGTVGVGNIAGVSVAIMLGGSGAVLWMWIGAILAMALKYAEITLGMLTGGAPEYIMKAFGKAAALIFSVLLITDAVVMGGVIQSSAVSEAMQYSIGLSPVVSGVLLSISVATVFIFRFDLYRLSSVVVPIMSFGYVICALIVIAIKAEELPKVFTDIFKSAFSPDAAVGGALGFMFTPAVRQGIVKGLFSNEAGCGTAPMAHASSKEKVPARQGLFGIFEVFADTLLMCTLTALVLLLTGNTENGGVKACMAAFESVLGTAAPPILSAAVLLFAFSAIVSFGYYGMQCLKYLNIGEKGSSKFIIVYSLAVFCGATVAPLAAWSVADIVVCLMLLINTSAVFVCRQDVVSAHKEFYSHIGKRSHSASRTRSLSAGLTKNESPISDTEINRGSIP